MGRLIDADMLIENAFEVHTKEFGTVWVVGVDAINEQPTAYDVEKVEEQIEERRANFDCGICRHFYNGKEKCNADCTDALVDDLLDIVKRGGAE